MGHIFDETPQEAGVRRFVGFILWLLCLIVFAAILAANAGAQTMERSQVFRATGQTGAPVVLRLFETPCSDAAVLAHLAQRATPAFIGTFKTALLTWEGMEWASCWVEFGGMVYSIDAEGSRLQPIDRRLFKDEAI